MTNDGNIAVFNFVFFLGEKYVCTYLVLNEFFFTTPPSHLIIFVIWHTIRRASFWETLYVHHMQGFHLGFASMLKIHLAKPITEI